MNLCPEFENPEKKTGCLIEPVLERVVKLEKLQTALSGSEGHPEEGFIFKAELFFNAAIQESHKKWTRMQKLVAASIVVPILAGLIGWGAVGGYTFVKRVDEGLDQLKQIHKSQGLPDTKKGIGEAAPETTLGAKATNQDALTADGQDAYQFSR